MKIMSDPQFFGFDVMLLRAYQNCVLFLVLETVALIDVWLPAYQRLGFRLTCGLYLSS